MLDGPQLKTTIKITLWLVSAGLIWMVVQGGDAAPVFTPGLAPQWRHVLGTDNSGRDILSLTLQGGVTSLTIGLGAALGATGLGAWIGCLAGYRPGVMDNLLMRLTDVFLLIPMLPLVVVLAAYIGPGLGTVVLLLTLTGWPATARIIRARVLGLRESAFVMNTRNMGGGTIYVVTHHILPNCSELLLAKFCLTAAAAMLTEAGIAFLGLGDPGFPSWGNILHDAFSGAALINSAWWWVLPPLTGITASVQILHTIGQRLVQAGTPDVKEQFPVDGFRPCHPVGLKKPSPVVLLTVDDLTIAFPSSRNNQRTTVVSGLHLDLKPGEKMAVIGATGSGKSLLLTAILGLLPGNASVSGCIQVAGMHLADMDSAQLRRYRGRTVGYVPQGTGQALNPLLCIQRQLTESLCFHGRLSHRAATLQAETILTSLSLSGSPGWLHQYPHHLSGGMIQRVLIAMALSGRPCLLLADEPTKGLDSAAIAAIVETFQMLRSETVLAVTHDLGFARALGGQVMVMLDGCMVEQAPAVDFFQNPGHPYSRMLVSALPENGARLDDIRTGIPSNQDLQGCGLRFECPMRTAECRQPSPLFDIHGRKIRCWRYAT